MIKMNHIHIVKCYSSTKEKNEAKNYLSFKPSSDYICIRTIVIWPNSLTGNNVIRFRELKICFSLSIVTLKKSLTKRNLYQKENPSITVFMNIIYQLSF